MMQLSLAVVLLSIAAACLADAAARVIQQVLALGTGGVAFLAYQRETHGDAFQIGTFTPQLVVLFDPAAIRLFFTAPVEQIKFHLAVEHITHRVFEVH